MHDCHARLDVRTLTNAFPCQPYKLHKLDNGPKEQGSVTREEALKMYTEMQTIRRLEAAAGNLYKEKIVRGFCHLYSGQEACAVGKPSV